MGTLALGFVVDASVSAAWFLPDEASPRTEAALEATTTHDVWVPALWLLEMGNLLLRAQRRRRITADKRRELAAAASALRIRVDREPVAIDALDELAARQGLTAYDAAYLELALRRAYRWPPKTARWPQPWSRPTYPLPCCPTRAS